VGSSKTVARTLLMMAHLIMAYYQAGGDGHKHFKFVAEHVQHVIPLQVEKLAAQRRLGLKLTAILGDYPLASRGIRTNLHRTPPSLPDMHMPFPSGSFSPAAAASTL
jgi:hypothetical protein